MAIYSMTGFGRGEVSTEQGLKITVELTSVNRKQLDCNVSMPRELGCCESKLQACVASQLKRGHIKGAVTLESCAGGDSGGVDIDGAEALVKALRRVAGKLNLADDLTASSLLLMPECLESRPGEIKPEQLWPDVEKAVMKALTKLKSMRCAEGGALETDIRKRLIALREISGQIAKVAPDVPRQYKKMLEERLEKLLPKSVAIDADLIAREVAVFADRCDISEELTRLESHFEQSDKIFEKGGLCGRTLDFLCQEMFREINTTGSKAANAEISKWVINFKAGLEAMREQIQNIE